MTAAIFRESDPDGTTPTRTSIALTVIAQDPSVADDSGHILRATAPVPTSRLEPGPRSSRFHVVDYDSSTSQLHEPVVLPPDADQFEHADDEELRTAFAFHAQQVYAVAARTLATFEAALGRRLSWGFGGHQLHLVPHAFCEANAYYSKEDRALLFGYVPDGENGTIYTCLSHDVVVHETTHAVLDGLRRRFLEPGLPDQSAFHEGFADIVALLSITSLRPVVEACLGKADENGRIPRANVEPDALRGSVLTGVAEQLGRVLTHGRGALRQSALDEPPPGWQDDPAFAEPHRRGEVLVAATLAVLIELWTVRLEPLLTEDRGRHSRTVDRARAAEEGARAAGQLLTMLIRGLDYLPPVEFEFGDFIDAVLLADVETVPNDDLGYREVLTRQFARFGITRPPSTTQNLLSGEFVPTYYGLNFAAMRTNADEVFRFIWQNNKPLGIDTTYYTHVEAVEPSQRVGPDGLIVTETVANYVQMLELTATEFESTSGGLPTTHMGEDTHVLVFGGGTIVFDQFGRAKLHIYKRLDDWDRQNRRLVYLFNAGLFPDRGLIGSSYGEARGQLFAELHAPDTGSGEAW